MIIKSSKRGGSKRLAEHLVKTIDDDGVCQQVIVSGDRHLIENKNVRRALATMDVMALSNPHGIEKHLYHVMLNPSEDITDAQWERCWRIYEAEYGLQDYTFIEVTHIKGDRKHQHRVYELVGFDHKVLQISHNYQRNEKVARILEYELGHSLTVGKHSRSVIQNLKSHRPEIADWMEQHQAHTQKRPVAETSHKDRQMESRTKIQKTGIKAILQEALAHTDNGREFQKAIAAHNLALAQGKQMILVKDAEGNLRPTLDGKNKLPNYVVVDEKGGTHSPRRMLGLTNNDLFLKWTDLRSDTLLTVEKAKEALNPAHMPKVDRTDLTKAQEELAQTQRETEHRIVKLEGQQAHENQLQLIEPFDHWQQAAGQERVKSVGGDKPEKGDSADGRQPGQQRIPQFFIADLRHQSGKEYEPKYGGTIDPDNAYIDPAKLIVGEATYGDFSVEEVAVVEAAAHQSKNRKKQLKRAHWYLEKLEEGRDFRFDGRATATSEFMFELSRQAKAHGETHVLRVEFDVNVAIRLYLAGHSQSAIKRAVIAASIVATGLPSSQHQRIYADKVIARVLRHPKVRAMREELLGRKRSADRIDEMRLHKLNLATEVPPRRQPPRPDRGPELELGF